MKRSVEMLTGVEAQALARRVFGGSKPSAILVPELFKLSGWVDAVCRNPDGSTAWEVHQKNLVTDFGRQRFVDETSTGPWGTMYIAISPSTETPLPGRNTLMDDGGTANGAISAGLTPTTNSTTLVKTWSTTFTTPAVNRTIGTVGLVASNTGYDANFGLWGLTAYTLLTTPKTQSTTQTLEVQYKITLTPTY